MLHSPAEKKRKRVGERMRENKKKTTFHLKTIPSEECTLYYRWLPSKQSPPRLPSSQEWNAVSGG